jgi:CRP/FNR family transcriptional regulator, anaerobic regulatory protein
MDTEHIIKYLASITDLSIAFVQEIEVNLREEHYKSQQIIQGMGQPQTHLWYVQSGIARSYIYDDQGLEHTLRFWQANEVIFSYVGYWNQPSQEYIEILGDSILFSYTYQNLESLRLRHHEMTTIIRSIIGRYHQQENQRNRFHTLSTDERYLRFRNEHPSIFKNVPLRMIASYLQMSRENLSRIISKGQ